jgi:hypothetical protein
MLASAIKCITEVLWYFDFAQYGKTPLNVTKQISLVWQNDYA